MPLGLARPARPGVADGCASQDGRQYEGWEPSEAQEDDEPFADAAELFLVEQLAVKEKHGQFSEPKDGVIVVFDYVIVLCGTWRVKTCVKRRGERGSYLLYECNVVEGNYPDISSEAYGTDYGAMLARS